MDDNKACETPREDLMNDALKHYEEASSALGCWNSDIPKAIRHYYAKNEGANKPRRGYLSWLDKWWW